MNQAGGGYELVLTGVIFSLAGLWLDRRIGTVPLFTVSLALLGFVGSVLNIFYRYKRETARLEAEAETRRSGRAPDGEPGGTQGRKQGGS